MPFSVEAHFGKDWNYISAVCIIIAQTGIFPVEIINKAGASADIEPAVELIAVACSEARADVRIAGTADNKADVDVEKIARVDKTAIATHRLHRPRRNRADCYNDNG